MSPKYPDNADWEPSQAEQRLPNKLFFFFYFLDNSYTPFNAKDTFHFLLNTSSCRRFGGDEVVDYTLMIIISRHPTEKEPHNNGPPPTTSKSAEYYYYYQLLYNPMQ